MARWLVVIVPLVACAPSLDNGLFHRIGVDIHQDSYPVTVERDVGVDASLVADAIRYWNSQLGREVFVSEAPGEVTVAVGLAPCLSNGECPEGIALVGYDRRGNITSCEVTLSSDIAFSRALLLLVLKHELGHCLGLEDDPPSIELNSIMGDPPLPGATVTDHDRSLL